MRVQDSMAVKWDSSVTGTGVRELRWKSAAFLAWSVREVSEE